MLWFGVVFLACGIADANKQQPIEADLYGDLVTYAYYFVDLLVGEPPQLVSAIVDTGSTLAAFACSDCTHCGKHLDGYFNFGASETSRWLNCGHGSGPALQREEKAAFQCPSCHGTKCGFDQRYREGSSLVGNFFTDLVRIGNFPETIPVRATLGCDTDERKLFYSQAANGIFGLAPHRTGKAETVLEILFQQNFPKIFALCLSREGGRLSVGDANRKFHKENVVWTDMTIGNYYGLTLQGISVDEESAGSAFGSTIVDSGTTFTYLPPVVYKSIKSAIAKKCESGRYSCATKVNENCWSGTVDDFPVIKVHLGNGKVILWRAKHGYLYLKGIHWCYAFEDAVAQETVLGASFMLQRDVIFDLGNGKLGFAESDCPVVSHRDAFNGGHVKETPGPSTRSSTTSTSTTTTTTTTSTTPDPAAIAPVGPSEDSKKSIQETLDLPATTPVFSTVSVVLIFAGIGALAALIYVRRRLHAQIYDARILTTTVGVPLDERDIWLQPVQPSSDAPLQ